jgi:hypothetical protein
MLQPIPASQRQPGVRAGCVEQLRPSLLTAVADTRHSFGSIHSLVRARCSQLLRPSLKTTLAAETAPVDAARARAAALPPSSTVGTGAAKAFRLVGSKTRSSALYKLAVA